MELHAGQQAIFADPAASRVVVAGRGWGKSVLAEAEVRQALASGWHVLWCFPRFHMMPVRTVEKSKQLVMSVGLPTTAEQRGYPYPDFLVLDEVELFSHGTDELAAYVQHCPRWLALGTPTLDSPRLRRLAQIAARVYHCPTRENPSLTPERLAEIRRFFTPSEQPTALEGQFAERTDAIL
jgi:hypothetical protein